jgi:hypothetical protein
MKHKTQTNEAIELYSINYLGYIIIIDENEIYLKQPKEKHYEYK